jgi:hypothetical protein
MRKLAGKDILQEGNIYIDDLAKLVNAKDIANLWSELGRLRNDLAHCGMNRHPMAAEKIRASAIALMPSINNLFAEIIA